jgi:hypothetical protein
MVLQDQSVQQVLLALQDQAVLLDQQVQQVLPVAVQQVRKDHRVQMERMEPMEVQAVRV